MPRETPFGVILALWGAGLGAAAQYGKVSVIFDMLPAVYPEAGPALGFTVSLVGFVGILLGVVAGLVVARIRFRRALIWALWLGAGISLFHSLLPPLPWMLVSRGIEGLSHLAIVVAAPTLIAQLAAEKDRGFALTLWGTFFGVAFALLAFAGRPLAQEFGPPALFAAHGAYMAGFALLLTAHLQRLPEEGGHPPLSLLRLMRDHGTIYRSPHVSAPAVSWLFYTFSFVSILTVLPPYLAPETRLLVIGSMPIASIAVSMTLGVLLLRRFSAVQVVKTGFAAAALCAFWLWAAPGSAVACLALAAAMGLIQGASFAAVPQLNATAAAQAQANGALAQMGNLGNTLGTPVMVAALAGIGYAALPILAGGAFVLGLVAHLWLGARRNG